MNKGHEYLQAHGETVDDYDGMCGELANNILSPGDNIIYVEGPGCPWRYHMVPLIDGLIHDAWCPGDALSLHEWAEKMCSGEITIALNGDDIWTGDADDVPYDLPALRPNPSTKTEVNQI